MKPDSLLEEERKAEPKKPIDLLEQESVTRFDRSRNNSKEGNNANRNKKKKKGTPNNRPQQQVEGINRPQQPQRENEGRPQPAENGNRGDRENRPRNNNNNRNRGQNQGRNNENRRPERRQERPQNQERPQDQNPDRKETQIKRNRKIMKSLLRNSLFCLLGICLMAACNENTVYHSYQSLPDEGWGKSDTLSFLIPVTDSIPPTLRLFAEVRNRTDYPYHNLHLFISQNLQDSTVWRTDTITINLADSTGRWIGNGWGSIYQSAVFIKSVRPLYPANYTFKIMNGMKDEKLSGINDIGIRIERQEN